MSVGEQMIISVVGVTYELFHIFIVIYSSAMSMRCVNVDDVP